MRTLALLLLCTLASAQELDVVVGNEATLAEGDLLVRPRAAFAGGVYLAVWQDGWR